MLMRSQFVVALFFILQLTCPAATNSVIDVADTEIIQGSASSTTKMHTGANSLGVRHRAMLRFNLDGSIPTNAIITNVSLTVTVQNVPPGGANALVDLRRLLV